MRLGPVVLAALACATFAGRASAADIDNVRSLELGVRWGSSGPEPGYFPFYVGVLLILFGAYNGMHTLIVKRGDRQSFLERRHMIRLGTFFIPMVFFVVATILLGLYVGTALYLFYVAWRQGGYRPHFAVLLGVGFPIALYVVFETLFKVPLLKGPIEPLLGIY